ncbi:Protein phosphatase 1D [Orchesella cincta]|uniref:Protein phosphatase 1D n=1 Tax=Orchesella cincta TaxID=48709 RepID=A0A1D2MY20_ORCCI|nr:Protein phosphatase 1D [Orchesella cincta]
MDTSIGVNLRVTAHSNQGGRKYMEDMFCVAYQPTSDERDLLYAYFGIFDGHGGREAALYAKTHLMDHIVSQKNFWSDNDELILRAIRDGFISVHHAMWRELETWPRTPSGLPSTSGTTASVAFVRRGKLYIGHVGDSGIVLGYQDPTSQFWKAKSLTMDHKPESPVEHARIKECGGKVVAKSGVPRVVWNRPKIGHKGPVRRSTLIDEIPFLAVARSLGDLWSYNSEQDEFIVSPVPDCSVIEIDVNTHRCLILGSDGLWNMLSAQDAVNSVYFAEKNNERQNQLAAAEGSSPPSSSSKNWINPSKRLVDRALDRWLSNNLRADNTSVVTVVIDPPGPPKAQRQGFSRHSDDGVSSPDRHESRSPSRSPKGRHKHNEDQPAVTRAAQQTTTGRILERAAKREKAMQNQNPISRANEGGSRLRDPSIRQKRTARVLKQQFGEGTSQRSPNSSVPQPKYHSTPHTSAGLRANGEDSGVQIHEISSSSERSEGGALRDASPTASDESKQTRSKQRYSLNYSAIQSARKRTARQSDSAGSEPESGSPQKVMKMSSDTDKKATVKQGIPLNPPSTSRLIQRAAERKVDDRLRRDVKTPANLSESQRSEEVEHGTEAKENMKKRQNCCDNSCDPCQCSSSSSRSSGSRQAEMPNSSRPLRSDSSESGTRSSGVNPSKMLQRKGIAVFRKGGVPVDVRVLREKSPQTKHLLKLNQKRLMHKKKLLMARKGESSTRKAVKKTSGSDKSAGKDDEGYGSSERSLRSTTQSSRRVTRSMKK